MLEVTLLGLACDTGVGNVTVVRDTGLSGVALGEYVAWLTGELKGDDTAVEVNW